MLKDLKLVVFDLDGVILDSEPIHAASIVEIMREWHVDGYDPMANVGMSSYGMWEKLIAAHGADVTPEQMIEKSIDYDEAYMHRHGVQPSRGLLQLLDFLDSRDIAAAVASSSERRFVLGALRLLGIQDRFGAVVTGTDCERKKPWPDLYLRALSQMGVPPARAAAIEDSSPGVRAAKSAGLYCVGYRNPTSGDQDLSEADCVINALSCAAAHLLG